MQVDSLRKCRRSNSKSCELKSNPKFGAEVDTTSLVLVQVRTRVLQLYLLSPYVDLIREFIGISNRICF